MKQTWRYRWQNIIFPPENSMKKKNKFYVNIQVFYTARNDVQVYSMQQHKNIFGFDSFFLLLSNILFHVLCIVFFTLYIQTQEEGVYLSRYLMEKRISMIQESINESLQEKNSNIKSVYSRGYGRYIYEMLFNWMKRKEALISLTCVYVGMHCSSTVI